MPTAKLVLKAKRAFGPDVEGEALVSRDPIHFVMDIAPETGRVIGVKHSLFGENVAGKILVISSAKGGVQSAMGIAELVKNNNGPKALVYDKTNPIMVHGAVMTNIPIMDDFDQNPVEVIKSGDKIKIKPAKHVIEVERK